MEVGGVGFQSHTSYMLLPARGDRNRRHPWRLKRFSRSLNRASRVRSPFNSRHQKKKPAVRRVSLEVAGVEPASPSANRRHLQVYPSVQFVGEGAAERRAFLPVFRFSPPASPDPGGSKPWLVSDPPSPQGGGGGNPSLSVLTQRERSCHYRWQVNFCRIRRSASPPAARDPDRPGRVRCTPKGESLEQWITHKTTIPLWTPWGQGAGAPAPSLTRPTRIARAESRRVSSRPRRKTPRPGSALIRAIKGEISVSWTRPTIWA